MPWRETTPRQERCRFNVNYESGLYAMMSGGICSAAPTAMCCPALVNLFNNRTALYTARAPVEQQPQLAA